MEEGQESASKYIAASCLVYIRSKHRQEIHRFEINDFDCNHDSRISGHLTYTAAHFYCTETGDELLLLNSGECPKDSSSMELGFARREILVTCK